MDIQEIYALMDRFDASSLNRLKLEMGDTKLTLEKGLTPVTTVVSGGLPVAAPVTTTEVTTERKEERGEEIKAPFVGTFYSAPSPDKEPFVTPGQQVKKGDVVGIIEAMKLMNEIVAPMDGVIEAILVEDGSMVEYNQALMTVKKG
ncbi:MAG: acetyl-CoA carboxylase biotin carboxyl carrier protein [Lachnospiraceae bacterium]|nr:acetyl-CoA carboxylase biotin carboxyl carrier protein [Lachnospiraceae bacterium]